MAGEAFDNDKLRSLSPNLCLIDVSGTMVTRRLLKRLEQLAGNNAAFTVIAEDCPYVIGGQSSGTWPEIPQSVIQEDDEWLTLDGDHEL